MSLHLPHPPDDYSKDEDTESLSGSSDQEDDDQNWDDWVSDSFAKQSCKSLFDEKTFLSVEDVLRYDQSNYAFDLRDTCSSLCSHLFSIMADHLTDMVSLLNSALDFHGRVRLINYIRRVVKYLSNSARTMYDSGIESIPERIEYSKGK
jgi:protein arginine N-methyltransferase 3